MGHTQMSVRIISRGHRAGGESLLSPLGYCGADRHSKRHSVVGRNREGGGSYPMAEVGG